MPTLYVFMRSTLWAHHKVDAVRQLITHPDAPQGKSFTIRANPLNYQRIMAEYGFREVQQEFCHYHSAPPLTLPDDIYEPMPELPDMDKWKLAFQCSIYGSRLIKEQLQVIGFEEANRAESEKRQ